MRAKPTPNNWLGRRVLLYGARGIDRARAAGIDPATAGGTWIVTECGCGKHAGPANAVSSQFPNCLDGNHIGLASATDDTIRLNALAFADVRLAD